MNVFYTVFLVGLLAVMSPGPDFLIVTRMSLLYSRAAGVATAFGIVTGLIFWITCSIAGLSIILAKAAIAFTILKYAGAAYLIWIGCKALGAKKQEVAAAESGSKHSSIRLWQAYRTGLLVNFFNAKCALFFVSLFSVIIPADTPTASKFICGAEIMFISAAWFSLVATVLSIPKVRNFFQRIVHWIDRATGTLLIALGLKIAFSRD